MKPRAVPAQPKQGLARRTMVGMLWLGGQSVVSKVLALAGQLVLAWLLAPEDFGVYAACLVALQFTNALRSGGMGPVLVQRHKRLDLWGPVGFQLSVVLGLVSMVAVLTATPLLTSALERPVPAGLGWFMAAEALLVSLTIVPRATLQSEMRFGTLAGLAVGSGALLIVSQVGLAWTGLGVLALVAPRPFVVLVNLIAMAIAARPPVIGQMKFRRWRLLLGDSVWVLLALLSFELTRQGDRVLLLSLAGAAELGLYFFAFNLATQAVTMITTSLQSLLLPALSKLRGQDERQRAAVASAAVRLAVVALPVCAVQAVVAEPMFAVLFNEEFADGWPIFAVLNLAMIFRLMNPLAANLIQARGRFRTYFVSHLTSAVIFLASTAIGWSLGGLVGVAFGVAGHAIIGMMLFYGVAFGFGAGAVRVLLRAIAAPLTSGAAASGLGLLAVGVLPEGTLTSDLLRCGAGGVIFGLSYLAGVWLLDRATIASIVSEFTGLLPGHSRGGGRRVSSSADAPTESDP